MDETVENQTTPPEEGSENPTTLAAEGVPPDQTVAAGAIKVQIVHEGKATVAVVATKALVVQETAD